MKENLSPKQELIKGSPESTLAETLTLKDRENNEFNLIKLIDQNDWKSILLDLIKREHIDPWNIDVSFLATKYLERIQSLQETNLRIPANAILCCAILVKTKASTLKLNEDKKDELPFIDMNNDLPELMPTAKLRQEMITLDELVSAIEEIIDKTKSKSFTKKSRAMDRIDLNLNLSSFNVEAHLEEVMKKLKQQADKYDMISFSSLLKNLTVLEVIQTFMTLLYLMNKGLIVMWQESFFGEVFVRILPEKEKTGQPDFIP